MSDSIIRPLKWVKVARFEERAETAIGRCSILMPEPSFPYWLVIYPEGNFDKEKTFPDGDKAEAFVQKMHNRQVKKWLVK